MINGVYNRKGEKFPFSFSEKVCEYFHKKNLDEIVPKIVKDFTKNLDERCL